MTFFESVKLRDKPVPIQKMVTTPILAKGQPIGVAEVSRKGAPARGTAGPDFTDADLRAGEGDLRPDRPLLAEARPDDF